jgi:hypothetical protein
MRLVERGNIMQKENFSNCFQLASLTGKSKRKSEFTAFADPAVHPDLTTLRFDEFFRDSEAQPGAGAFMRTRNFEEAVKYFAR